MTLPLSPGTWTLDPVHSVVQFSVRHLGISMIRGRFTTVEASLDVGESLEACGLRSEIDLSSIDTGNPDRDGHVRSSDFFDAETRPKMTFSDSSIAEAGDGTYKMAGTLSLNGHARPETLDVSFFGIEDNPFDGTVRAGFLASGQIDRTDYGIDWQVPLASGGIMLGQKVDITIDAQLVAPSTD